MRLVEVRLGSSIEAELGRLRREGLAVGQIAERLEVPYGTAYRWLVRFGLDDASLIRKALGARPRPRGGRRRRLADAGSAA